MPRNSLFIAVALPLIWSFAMPEVFAQEPRHDLADQKSGENSVKTRYSREDREAKECLLGLKGLGVLSWPREDSGRDTEFATGIAIFVERAVVPGLLEIEFSAGSIEEIDNEQIEIYIIDLVFKMPIHINHFINPYFGLGPTLAIEDKGSAELDLGVSTVVGSYFWYDSRFGLDVEIAYNYFPEGEGEHEIAFAFGPVIHF